MAITNTDIYNMADVVEKLKQQCIPDVSQSTALTSTFGYMGLIFAQELTSVIQNQAELCREFFPTLAKLDKSIMSHAVMAKITNLFATPAQMDVMMCIRTIDIDENMVSGTSTIVIDKETKVSIDNKYEYHLPYNIIISRTKSVSGEWVYVAQYDIDKPNIFTNITNPYLLPPTIINYSGDEYLMITCKIIQVEYQNKYKKITSDDTIENKSFQFEFESQIASFDILVTSGDGTETVITPIIENSVIDTNSSIYKYCYYSYIDEYNIRIKFISTSYNPKLNDNITVRLTTTQGQECNFPYKDTITAPLKSSVYKYAPTTLLFIPLTESYGGTNKMTIDEIKKMVPRELLSRGSLTCEKDLDNFFNMINDENNTFTISKKIDNQTDRIYNAYLLTKDDKRVIPTNTIDIKIPDSVLRANNDTIKPGTIICLDPTKEYAEISPISHEQLMDNFNNPDFNQFEKFYYTIPYNLSVIRKPLSSSYKLDIINQSYLMKFAYINRNAFLQFIATSINIKREFLTDRKKYKITTTITQNTEENFDLITKAPDGSLENNSLKAILLFYDANNSPLRYKQMDVIDYDSGSMSYTLEAILETDDDYDSSYKFINILNLNDLTQETESHTNLPQTVKTELYIFAKFDTECGRLTTDRLFPNLDGYSLCNRYDIEPGLDLYINYSEVTQSVITVNKPDEMSEMDFYIRSVPVIEYRYMQDEERVKTFIDKIYNRKLYIDNALTVIEQSFSIDFKLFNTYGPSHLFKCGYDKIPLDRVNISLNFRMKFDSLAEEDLREVVIAEIKDYIEQLNNISDWHFSNLDQYLRNKYPSIQWIEFLGINDYDTSIQYIINDKSVDFAIPEFLNINSTDGSPSIKITLG